MEKKFVIPEALLVLFGQEDIITESGTGGEYGDPGDEWWSDED